MKALSVARPLPSMLTLIPSLSNAPVNSWLVNWLPWSVLKMRGAGRCMSAPCKASRQKEVSSVLLICQEITYRLYQSITAVRYRNPLPMAM
jgi:hypothetical protein